MSEQLSVFPVDDYADRLYYNNTSTRTKRPIKMKEGNANGVSLRRSK